MTTTFCRGNPSPDWARISFSPRSRRSSRAAGGIRTGTDVFKALALGADAVLIGRPFVPMVYGDGAQGVATYIEKIGSELRDTMAMCGVHTLDEITRDCVRVM